MGPHGAPWEPHGGPMGGQGVHQGQKLYTQTPDPPHCGWVPKGVQHGRSSFRNTFGRLGMPLNSPCWDCLGVPVPLWGVGHRSTGRFGPPRRSWGASGAQGGASPLCPVGALRSRSGSPCWSKPQWRSAVDRERRCGDRVEGVELAEVCLLLC